VEQRAKGHFNINDYVKAKLTDLGREIYYHQYDETNKQYGREVIKPHYPDIDTDGYSTFQLWKLMTLYGDSMQIGFDVVFESEIILM
jgi:hypothetical protein